MNLIFQKKKKEVLKDKTILDNKLPYFMYLRF